MVGARAENQGGGTEGEACNLSFDVWTSITGRRRRLHRCSPSGLSAQDVLLSQSIITQFLAAFRGCSLIESNREKGFGFTMQFRVQ